MSLETPDCIAITEDLTAIVKLIDKNMHAADMHKKIDVFFYVERKIRAKQLCLELKRNPHPELLTELSSLHNTIKSRWKEDYKFLATPESLHPYLKDN